MSARGARGQLRLTLGLLGILALLCLAYWLILANREHTQQRVAESKRVFDFAPSDVVTIELQHADGATIAALRTDEGWQIDRPDPGIQPNPVVWERVANGIAQLANERIVDDAPGDLATYGLEDPGLRVIAGTSGGKIVQLEFGEADPTRQFRYARTGAGDAVFLVANTAHFEVNRTLEQLRETLAFDTGGEDITRIEYARIWTGTQKAAEQDPSKEIGAESVRVILHRGPDDLWRLIEPVHAKADQELVTELVTELQFMRGRHYIDDPQSLNDYGLNPPTARITIQAGDDGNKQTLLLGWPGGDKDDDGMFVKQEARSAVFRVDNHVISLLPKSPDGFRDRRLITRDFETLERVQYARTDGVKMTFALDSESGWTVREPALENVSQTKVVNFLRTLRAAKADSFVRRPGELTDIGLDPPRIAITFYFENEDAPRAIRIGGPAPAPDTIAEDAPEIVREYLYAQQDTGDVVTVLEAAARGWTKTPQDFRESTILNLDPERVTRVELGFDGTQYAFEKAEEHWRVLEPANRRWDSQTDMAALIETLARAEMTAIEVSEDDFDHVYLETYGLDSPRLNVLAIETADDGTTSAAGPLIVGAVTPDNSRERFAMLSESSEVLRVRQALLDDVRDALRGVVPE